MNLPVNPPVAPMLAKAADAIPIEPPGQWRYEPKWDGFRCVVFRDGDEVELASRNQRPLTRYFPEVVEAVKAGLPERCVLDGEVVVVGPHGLDWDALSNRIHPADSRVRLLAEQTPAALVGFDVLGVDGEDLTGAPFTERRDRLVAIVGPDAPVRLTPLTDDPAVAQDWFTRFEGAGLDGVVAKAAAGPYTQGERTMVKVKHQRTADCVVAGFRWHKSGDGVGSLLLGLYDDSATLNHVGVAAAFSAKRRKALTAEVEPYVMSSLEGHPWASWMEQGEGAAMPDGRLPGAPSRWTGKKDMSWVPMRPERVVEVAFNQLQGDPAGRWGPHARFRHSTTMLRWRPDRDPESCRYDQLEVIPPVELQHVFAS